MWVNVCVTHLVCAQICNLETLFVLNGAVWDFRLQMMVKKQRLMQHTDRVHSLLYLHTVIGSQYCEIVCSFPLHGCAREALWRHCTDKSCFSLQILWEKKVTQTATINI